MRFPDCVAARRPLPAAIAWPDAMSGHFFSGFFPPGRPKGKKPPRGAGSARSARAVGALFPAGPPQGEKSPLGGQEAHIVRAPWGPYFIPKRPSPFMPPMARIIFAMPPFFICFIIPCICSN
ncbi:Uncharacterised protein [Achromobacter spanius]|nr:Uncharacterised protein [Achromobacter denitrificans]VEE56127.1 Uncharacterised protein [Achromobacter spanius]